MKTLCKVAFTEMLKIGLFPLRLLKIKSNRILFTGLTGGDYNEYSCNPKYLCEYMMEHCPGEYEIIWAVSDKEKYAWLKEKGIRLVKHFSLSSFPWLMTAKVVVTNGSYAPWFPFRKDQYVINTWHGGGAYKKVNTDMQTADWATRKMVHFCANNIRLFLSSCTLASERLFREGYHYQGEILEIGMPRNDLLIQGKTEEMACRVKEYYQIPREDYLILYAPTYRYGNEPVKLDADRVLKILEEKGEKWHFLYRAHRFLDERTNLQVRGSKIIDASVYPDMQELLAASDWIITDYSSLIWDYSFLKRPCILYVPDAEEYMEKTGFYVDIHKWPYPMAKSEKELEELLRDFDMEACQKAIAEHHKQMGMAETGHACELTVRWIAEVCGK